MKYLRFQLMAALLCLVATLQAQTNVLRVDSVESPAGKTLILPIVMENQSDVTGVQFDLDVPFELAVDDDNMLIVNLSKTRANGHTVVTRKMGNSSNYNNYHYYSALNRYAYRYRFIIYSESNSLLLDNEGTLLTLQLTADAEVADGTELTVYPVNVTLSDPQMQNVLTKAGNGLITIKEIPRPDLMPTDVTFTGTETGPGQTLDVAWKVKNIGKEDAEGGWTEEIALVTGSGKVSKLLASTHYDGPLAANAEASRNVQLTMPNLIGVDGAVYVQVNVIADAAIGEPQILRDNNTAKSANKISVKKHLTLEVTPQRVSENQTWQRITLKLSRSGNWSELESFNVTTTNSKGEASTETRVPLTKLIAIQPGEASVLTYLNITNNSVLDADSLIHYKVVDPAEVGGYAPVEADLVILDDEQPTLTLTASKTDLKEGTDKTFNLTVQTERAPVTDLTVTLTSEDMKRFKTFPATIVIKAGETTGQMVVTVVDDDLSNGTETVKFTASAPAHNKGEALVVVTDDDLPVLELTLTPTQVQESDGPVSVTGVLRRTSNIDKKVTIRLTDDSNDGLYFGNRTLEMPKGTQELRFNFGPKDNQDVDGDRTYTVTAAVWLSSCSCSAVGEEAGHVSGQLTVLDDDGKALRLTSANGTVKEGGTTKLTVTRNTNDTTAPVTVTISSDFDDQLEYSHSVTIPAGQKSVDVEVKSKLNDVAGDSHTVIFTVASDGWASGTCWVMITDQTLPDAAIKDIAITPTSALVGEAVKLTLTIANEGNTAPLPAATQVKVYEQGNKDAIATFTIDDALEVGATRELVKSITPTKSVGKHRLYAVINENNNVQELSPNNNTSATIDVEVSSPFMATLATDRERYNQSDVVVFTGQLTGKDFADAEVDLYIVCDGTRQEQRVRADAEGAFTYKWELGNALSGHAIAGVCYPGAAAKDEITSFDIYGLRRYDTSYIKHQLTVSKEVETSIRLVNPGVLQLTGVKVEVVEKPDAYTIEPVIPATIAGGNDNVLLTYKLSASAQSTGNNWEPVKLLVTSNEGIELPITMYCYARMAAANLVTPNQRITTTMTKGQVREYPIQLINKGQGNTGKISLSMPDWISCAQGSTLAGINVGDTINVVLRFKPTDNMQLNVPVTGTIGFNVEYGNGTYANFSITPVSDKTGTLEVIVADEYTYYTDEKPHVKDAEVVLRNSVTNAIVAIDGVPCQGKSGEDGKVVFENLPEGYYKLSVTADKHDSYANNIIVDPGVTTTKVVNLSVESIKVSWTVEETEVEDVYDIVTTVTYETNVPAPVVDLIVPTRIPADSLAEGESLVFYAIATNKGLINALNSEITLPERTGIYLWEPLGENTGLTIAPQQSYILPVKVTRMSPTDSRMRRASSSGSSNGCHTVAGVVYEWDCGNDRKWHKVSKPITFEVCPGTPGGGGGGWGGGGGGLGNPGGGYGGGYGGGSYIPSITSNDDCNPCHVALGKWVTDCVQNFIPIWGCAKGELECNTAEYDKNDFYDSLSHDLDCTLTHIACTAEMCTYLTAPTIVGAGFAAGCTILGWVANGLTCIKQFIPAIQRCVNFYASGGSRSDARRSATYTYAYVQNLADASVPAEMELQAFYDYYTEVMGDTLWIHNTRMDEVEALLMAVRTYCNEMIDADKLRQEYKPEGITNVMFDKFIERINNTRFGVESENRIDHAKLEACLDKVQEAENMAVDAGYMSVDEWWSEALNTARKKLDESSGSVCSTITLQIKQTMTMTRQAFRGTLTVFNGNETVAMKDMKLNLVVSDMNNNVATSHEFQINAESLSENLKGELSLTSGWELAPGKEGTATVLFIPTKYAAPTEPVEWSFGGTLSYTDPYSDLEVTRELYPVTLTVKPSPELDLTYFMQRDVYGDDPLTPDIIEPREDAEFALLINNKGYGDATNVKMVTNQPEIIENEKGLFIDFEIVSSQVNGGPAALSFGQTIANDLGNIPAGKQCLAQWWLQSSLLGHFTSYKVEATHVTSYGNEDLSLLDQVTIHELIHGFTPSTTSQLPNSSTPQRAFLVNDVEDANDLPDQVYFTDATQADVDIAQSATATKQSRTEYLLSVLPKKAGWNYGNLLDPTAGKQKLLKVVRQSDGQELPLDNFWQTSRSLRDGQEWLYENRLHFVGEMGATTETYILTYEERPEVELDFTIAPVNPVYGEDNRAEGLVVEDVDDILVTFTKPIDAATFTADDVTYQVQGQSRDLSKMTITPKEGNAYQLSLSEVNKSLPNGYYVLTVQGAGITDNEGYNGLYGRKTDWVLFRGGLVEFHTKPEPAGSGNITMELVDDSDNPIAAARRTAPDAGSQEIEEEINYGSRFRLTATAKDGYEFVNWTLDGEVVSTEPVFITNATGDMNFVANFKKKEYRVEVTTDGNGTLSGAGTGIYEFDSELTVSARPDDEFILKEWLVDGVAQAADGDDLIIRVKSSNMTVKAVFTRDIFYQTLNLQRGWTWVSTFTKESVPLGELAQYADRILSQTQELFRDPVYGMVGGITKLEAGQAYKVNTPMRISRTLRGHLLGNAMSLKRGWNWMSFPFNQECTLSAITNAENGDVITSQNGFSEYANGSWEGDLEPAELTPGMGYIYKSVSEKTLTFSFGEPAAARSTAASSTAPLSSITSDLAHTFPSVLCVTARIYSGGMEQPGHMYTIYAMAGDELRGVSRYVGANHYLTVYGDDPVEITFVVVNTETGESFVADQRLTFQSDVVGSRKSPFAVSIGTATDISAILVMPNATVYDLQGRKVDNGQSEHKLAKGVYIVNGRKRYVK